MNDIAAEAPLRRIYDLTVAQFPDVTHDASTFLADIVAVHQNEPLRLKHRRELIEAQGLDYMMQSKFPQNEILTGLEHYLKRMCVADRDSYQWQTRLIQEQLMFRPEQ